MKKVALLLAAILMATGFVKAQSDKEEVDFMQAAFGMEKKAMVQEFVQVTDPVQKDAFWKLYDEYETQRKALGKTRIDLYLEYNAKYEKMTEQEADVWMGKVLDLSKKTDALLLNYYKKIKKAAGAVSAIQFYQVETYILTGIRNKIMADLPFLEKK
jgi:hypothetical protein